MVNIRTQNFGSLCYAKLAPVLSLSKEATDSFPSRSFEAEEVPVGWKSTTVSQRDWSRESGVGGISAENTLAETTEDRAPGTPTFGMLEEGEMQEKTDKAWE